MKKYVSLVLLFMLFCVCCKTNTAERRVPVANPADKPKRQNSLPLAKSISVEPVKEIHTIKQTSSVDYFNRKIDGVPTSPNDSPTRVRKPTALTTSQDLLTKIKEDK